MGVVGGVSSCGRGGVFVSGSIWGVVARSGWAAGWHQVKGCSRKWIPGSGTGHKEGRGKGVAQINGE